MVLDVIAAVFFAGISLVSIPANCLVVWDILSSQKVYNYYYCLIALQSVRDLLLHLLVNFYTVLTLANNRIILGQATCRVSAYFSRVWYFGTALNLAAITYERYHSLKDCLTHSGKITPKRAFFIILVQIILPLVSALPLGLEKTKLINLTSFYGCKSDDRAADVGSAVVAVLGVSLTVVFVIIPVIVIAKKSWQIFKIVQKHKRVIQQMQPGKILPCDERVSISTSVNLGNSSSESENKIENARKDFENINTPCYEEGNPSMAFENLGNSTNENENNTAEQTRIDIIEMHRVEDMKVIPCTEERNPTNTSIKPVSNTKQKKIRRGRNKIAVRITKETKNGTRDIKRAMKVLIVNTGFLLSLFPVLSVKYYARVYDNELEKTPKWLFLVVYWLNFACTILNPLTNSFREIKEILKKNPSSN